MHLQRATAVALGVALGTAGLPDLAQAGSHSHDGHGQSMQGDGGMMMQEDSAAAADASDSTEAFEQANATMHVGMDIAFSGDANVDFARSMIPHHQGAIDMARVLLDYGDDARLRALAEEIITAQEAEIDFLENWLAENDHR